MPQEEKKGATAPGGAPARFRGERSGNLLLALTVVVALIVILMLPAEAALFGLLGALAGYYFACHEGGGGRERYTGAPPPPPYVPLAGSPEVYGPADEPAPLPVFSDTVPPPREQMGASGAAGRMRYPGAIEIDEYDTEADAGHVDRSRYDAPPEGNPYDPMRVRSDLAAAPCVDDEANDNEIDGDERMAYQGAARNDATRVTAGTINRRHDMDKYFREELAEAEEREWYGRHEV
jgi:hypothetical protein